MSLDNVAKFTLSLW